MLDKLVWSCYGKIMDENRSIDQPQKPILVWHQLRFAARHGRHGVNFFFTPKEFEKESKRL